MGLRAKIHNNWLRRSVDILLYQGNLKGEFENIIKPFSFETIKVMEGELIEQPTLSLLPETLQSLIDELYENMGMLPTMVRGQFKEQDKVLEATKYHLEDMRKLTLEKGGL